MSVAAYAENEPNLLLKFKDFDLLKSLLWSNKPRKGNRRVPGRAQCSKKSTLVVQIPDAVT